jgi:hypothetical protein
MNCFVTFIFYRMGLFIETFSYLDHTGYVVCELISEEYWWNYVDMGKSVRSVPICQTQITLHRDGISLMPAWRERRRRLCCLEIIDLK